MTQEYNLLNKSFNNGFKDLGLMNMLVIPKLSNSFNIDNCSGRGYTNCRNNFNIINNYMHEC